MKDIWIQIENNKFYILCILICYFGYKKEFNKIKHMKTNKERILYAIKFISIGIIFSVIYIYLRKVEII